MGTSVMKELSQRLISTNKNLKGDPHKSEVFLNSSTLFAVKAENVYWNATKMHKTKETELSY